MKTSLTVQGVLEATQKFGLTLNRQLSDNLTKYSPGQCGHS